MYPILSILIAMGESIQFPKPLVSELSSYLKLAKRFGQLTLVPLQNLTIVKKELNT